jgi:hypothetical protein
MDIRSNYSFVRNFTPKPLPTIEVRRAVNFTVKAMSHHRKGCEYVDVAVTITVAWSGRT